MDKEILIDVKNSAGAIIFGNNTDSCKAQDINTVNLKDAAVFNVLSDYSLLCHLNRNDGVKFDRKKLNIYWTLKKTIYLPDMIHFFVTEKRLTMKI